MPLKFICCKLPLSPQVEPKTCLTTYLPKQGLSLRKKCDVISQWGQSVSDLESKALFSYFPNQSTNQKIRQKHRHLDETSERFLSNSVIRNTSYEMFIWHTQRDFLYIHCIGYFDLVCFYLRFFQNVKNSCLLTSSHQYIKIESWVKLLVNNDVNNSDVNKA